MSNIFLPASRVLAIAAIAAVSLLALGTTAAQNRPIVDLSVEIEESTGDRRGGYEMQVRVTNNSEMNVYNVVVNFESDPPVVDRFLPITGNFANGKWTIRRIGPGGGARLQFGRNPGPPIAKFFQARASIVSSSPKDTRGLEYNNRAEVWLHASTTSINSTASGGVGLQVEVGNLRPALSGQAAFKVSAKNTTFVNTGVRPSLDKDGVQVRITLSPGLSSTVISGNTAIWRVGDLPAARNDARRTKTLSIPVNLSGSTPLERRCLTAEVVEVTPPDTEFNRYDDVARVCLGDGPLELIGDSPAFEGEPTVQYSNWYVDLFTFSPCIGVTSYPCNMDDTLELVVEVALDDPYQRMKQRRDDTASPPESEDLGMMVLQPESVVFHVDDRQGRSMRDESVIWSTENLMNLRDSQRHLTASWTDLREDVTVTAPGGGDAPGRWLMRFAAGAVVLDATDSSKVTGNPWTPSDFYDSPSDYIEEIYVHFWALGTYKALFEITGTLSGTAYADSGTFTFHVGPVAELEVRDAGANPEVARGKRAYTIEAVNNGPDPAAAAVVTLADVPEGARVVASQGDYYESFCGGNGLCEGVWTIGEIVPPETARLSGQSTSATLTIITEGDPITATIENNRDYTVCINADGADVDASSESACEAGGNSWHTAEYYDYTTSDCFDNAGEKVDVSSRSDCEATTGNSWYSNDKDVRIESRPGTGQGHPNAPRSLRVDKFASLAFLRWQAVERVNGFDVSHYQVERNGVLLSETVGGTMYADLRGGAVNQSYRVRAVNSFGVPGPWSLAAGASGPLEQPGTAGLGTPTGLTATSGMGDARRIDLSWFAPSGETGLRYIIEHATDGAGPWTTLAHRNSGTTYSHTGSILLPGTTHYYRVSARKGDLISAWAYVQATTEAVDEDGEPAYFDPPGWPMNLRFTSLDRTAVTLVWDPPADDGGSRVTGYEYRVFGPCASGADAVCDIVAPTRVSGTSRRISGLNREGTYQFEVRALNAVGAGDWSQSIQKDVGPQTAGGGRVILSPSRLTVTEGSEATYRVKLSTEPTLPIVVFMHWNLSETEDEALGSQLPFQQGQVLLPSGYDTSGMSENCHGYNYQDQEMTYAWNVGVPITVVAPEDDEPGNGRLTILHDLVTVSAECLGMTDAEWSPDPVYDGMFGLALEVTERDND